VIWYADWNNWTGFTNGRVDVKEEHLGPIIGMVASRKCPLCGHSEIGYTTPDGEFRALKPGALVQVSEMPEPVPQPTQTGPSLEDTLTGQGEDQGVYKAWVPEPLKRNKKLRLKFGVMAKESVLGGPMTGDRYRSSFLRKLEKLIEREVHSPLPVILDRFFTAPHLASGNPRQIAQAMWRELEEVQRPVVLVSEWLEKQDQRSLAEMIDPRFAEASAEEPASEEQLRKELEALSLVEFLETL
jgi:hypothetical protein